MTTGACETLLKLFENVSKKTRVHGERATSLEMFLEITFEALSQRKQGWFLKLAELTTGAIAAMENAADPLEDVGTLCGVPPTV